MQSRHSAGRQELNKAAVDNCAVIARSAHRIGAKLQLRVWHCLCSDMPRTLNLFPKPGVGWKLWWRNERAACDPVLIFREPHWDCRALMVDSSSSISERGQNRKSNFIYISFNIKNQSVFCLLQREIGPFLGNWMLQRVLILNWGFPLKVKQFLQLLKNVVFNGGSVLHSISSVHLKTKIC